MLRFLFKKHDIQHLPRFSVGASDMQLAFKYVVNSLGCLSGIRVAMKIWPKNFERKEEKRKRIYGREWRQNFLGIAI